MSDLAKRTMRVVARLAQSASDRLDEVDLNQLPESAQSKLSALWVERAGFVEGVRELVTGFMRMHALLESVHETQRLHDARLVTLEMRSNLDRGTHCVPPPPPPLLSEEICLEEDRSGAIGRGGS